MTFNLILCGRNIKSFPVGTGVAELELEIRQVVVSKFRIYFKRLIASQRKEVYASN